MPWIRSFRHLFWIAYTENDFHEQSCISFGFTRNHAEVRTLRKIDRRQEKIDKRQAKIDRFNISRWPFCTCGEFKLPLNTRMEVGGVSHGHTPCFQCDTYGKPL